MEKQLKRIEIGIIILILISIINSITPFINNTKNASEPEQTSLPALPGDLNKDDLNEIIYKIKLNFNQSDWAELYNIFGEYAKAQLSVDEIKQEFDKLKPAVGEIGTYTYSHYLYEGNASNADWFEIHYKCRFERGKGTIKLSTRTVDGTSEVIGINIKLEEL